LCESTEAKRIKKEAYDLRKFLKNSKGFTLVELMMVIAVIGILAAVLIPKIGGTKDSARLSGVESNFRQAQAAVEANITRYRDSSANLQDILTNILMTEPNTLENPFDSAAAAVAIGTEAPETLVPGQIAIVVIDDAPITSVTITAYDQESNAMQTETITP